MLDIDAEKFSSEEFRKEGAMQNQKVISVR